MNKMAAVETITAGTKGDEMEKPSTSEEEAPAVLTETSAPLNFSELTPSQFGISVESFKPKSSNHKDKSRLAQMKVRRRSNVGVRGSPETNSLIRFMAQQKMKTLSGSQTTALVKSSPFFPRVASTLRQKMASFQNLMDVEESDACDLLPAQDRDSAGRCVRTMDNLSDGSGGGEKEEKENNPPTTPTPGKRRCRGLQGCSLQITQTLTPCSSLKDQEDSVCELQSAGSLPSDLPAKASSSPSSPVHVSPPSPLEMKPAGEDHTPPKSTVKKKKQVRFGGPLSPELFDKNLPPSTPLQKGGTPARVPTPGWNLHLRSLLKTPQSESQMEQYQPGFHSPGGVGASPTLAWAALCEGDEDEINHGKFVFPPMEDVDSAVTSDAEYVWPLNLNAAFHEESLSQLQTDFSPRDDTKPSKVSQMEVLDESVPAEQQPEECVDVSAPVQRRNRKKAVSEEKPCKETLRSGKRKRKQPEESEPAKRSTRSAAKSACGKMKESSAASRRWNKEVDRSLYGSRSYAAKNPTLSPISERLSFFSQTPAALQTSPVRSPAPNPEIHASPTTADDTQGKVSLAEDSENPSQESVPYPSRGKSRRSGPTVRRGLKMRKFSVPDAEESPDLTGGETEEKTSSSLEVSKGSSPEQCEPGAGEVNTDQLSTQTSADASCTDSGKSESQSPPPAEESGVSNTTKAKAKRGRRSSALKELQNCAKDCVTDENGHVDGAENIQSNAGGRGETEVAGTDLAPWQDDFNFEDVFKPAATRGQRSVRRSLRNRSHMDLSGTGAGLAWMPRLSPEASDARRRTRGRRASAALLVPQPEETQD
ncbi:cell division cycle-associated protein 2 isoform X2 [Cololabis saira]|uniref:cell division cycle-associated protein 2 isoform X2 n=1 Tax=Cololabis saira TaxID=129043 RepID=UPI002AD36AD2|nr:cell division cycle-associated protein 2 isoform X2 [Cololabis saira]